MSKNDSSLKINKVEIIKNKTNRFSEGGRLTSVGSFAEKLGYPQELIYPLLNQKLKWQRKKRKKRKR